MIAARRRTPVLVVALLALGLLVVMSIAYYHGTHGTSFDNAVDGRLSDLIPLRVAHAFADLGSGPVSGGTTVVLAGLLLWRRAARAAALVVLTPVISIVLVEFVLKPIVDRTFVVAAPWGEVVVGHPSFPSGHTAGACSVAFAITIVLLGPARPVPPRPARALAALALVLAAMCCVGLVAGYYHYATDVVGAMLLCLGVALLLALALTPRPADGVEDEARRATLAERSRGVDE